MPGRFFLAADAAEITDWAGSPCADQEPRFNISPGQEVLTLTEDGFRKMRWGLIPQGRKNARGRPMMEVLVNARSETVFDKSAFEGVKRCIVPAQGWYEWTGETRKKTAWRISPKHGGLLGFAGIYDVWQAPGGLEVPQVATVTCAPNADVAEIHHRMGVILRPADFPTWFGKNNDEAAALMRPLPDGGLTVSEAEGVDWNGP